MSAKRKPKPPTFHSPAGTAIFPYVNVPDTKWKTEGEYKVKLLVEGDAAAKIRKQVEKALEEAKAEAIVKAKELTAKNRKKVEAKVTDGLPINDEVDETGEETGKAILSFKAVASGVTKDGKAWKKKLPLFDAKGVPMTKPVYGGSTLICAYIVMPWVNPKCEYGVKLGLEAVQVIDLVSEGGARTASQFGFSEQEGYADDGDGPSMPEDSGDAGDSSDADEDVPF